MRIILLLSLTIHFNLFGQSPAQKKLEEDFVNDYCNCLQKFSESNPEKILYDATDVCVMNFFNRREKETQQILNERRIDPADYQKAKEVGKEIMYNTIDDLVEDCEFYRKTLIEYKSHLMAQLKITKESARSAIVDVKKKKGPANDNISRATYYSVLGVMHEFVGKKRKALRYYKKSLKAHPTTAAKGLRLLLKSQ